MKNYNIRTIFIYFLLNILSINVEAGNPLNCVTGTFDSKIVGDIDKPIIKDRLPTPREAIPPSLKDRVIQETNRLEKKVNKIIECNRSTNLCASFDTNKTLPNVSAWIGFEFNSKVGNYFIATYSQQASYLGNGNYSTPKWDKKHFWIHIGEKTVPFPIQPRFIGKDIGSINEWYTVDYVGYRRKGVDYTNYWENMSQSALIFLIDPKTKKILKNYLEYYDENDEYVGDFDLEIGDQLESYFLGFRKGQEDREYFFSLENITPITKQVTFSYQELYPSVDFNTTYGKELNFKKVEFKYMFESYGKTRSNFTDPKPIKAKKITSDKNITSSTNTTSNKSTSKSAPFSIFWSFLFVSIFIGIIKFKDNKYIKDFK